MARSEKHDPDNIPERDGPQVKLIFTKVKPEPGDNHTIMSQIFLDPVPAPDAGIEDLDVLQVFAAEMEILNEWDPLWLLKVTHVAWEMKEAGVRMPDEKREIHGVAKGLAYGLGILARARAEQKRMEREADDPDRDVPNWDKN